ncbi:carbamoyltransferase HypF [Campylobacter vulpis]|uniref:Carbamoyltransferase n=1 Tax=Campylobacter vulpis TaxID=1655500 RepID=A0A2G4QZA0_9BACT|nr:carbamoyltransferase HypF [Campylobacter vulpis]MBS4330685.1 carbamoyltransferase HypF [Campylobacter vulpis]MBS4438794.1 carbamoyltransferase HypF [Campylobacter vulpis]PHY89634.1 3-hydroxydecanoyl-ACP:CoA transacylase [Campylobacter vulpis]
MCHFTYKIRLKGLVQGVGMRPFIYTLALKLGLKGEVFNDGFGVQIKLNASENTLKSFLKLLRQDLPPLARIDELKITQENFENFLKFRIVNSQQSPKKSPLLSDFNLCLECKKEFYDVKNPRYLYPFITCTHCGPRFSIINNLPYDRKNTSMRHFVMCEFCQNEYENPLNRRFHAQPISCPNCAIPVFLKDKNGAVLACQNEAFKLCAKFLKEGKIVAIKGLGGFHLMCDAFNENALKALRERKNRPLKPFALMCKDIKEARALAHINQDEANLLTSKVAPIVLLKAKKVPDLIAPNVDKIGIFLAYTPLHLLLFEYFKGVLVATSANLSGESIIYEENSLRQKLGEVFDYYLDYEREIINSSDDSIAQIINGKTMYLRTSRALNPRYLSLDFSKRKKPLLALGAELKNEFVIFYENKLLISPYLGDLKSLDVRERFEKLLGFFKELYDLEFEELLCDKHPHFDYVKDFKKCVLYPISHHYAHFCAAYFEAGFKGEILGFIFDGTGYGNDGRIWGGEILKGDLEKYERIGHFESFKLINGDVKNIRNLALSVIFHYDLKEEATEFLSKIPSIKFRNLEKIYENSTLYTSSLGRIIDAFGSIVFDLTHSSYEAQIGLMCEKFYDKKLNLTYNFSFENGIIDFKEAFLGALKDDKTRAVTGFFNGLANCMFELSEGKKVLVSGGVFQNKTLLELLRKKGLDYFVPLEFPCNDSSIALGQMVHFLKCAKD